MARQVKVKLGDRDYTIDMLPIGRSKVWRESLALPFGELTQALQTASVVEINQFGDIAGLVRQLSGTLLGSVDKMLDLLFQYSDTLAQDRAYIEENAFDDEALEAFSEVLKLAYPLGQLVAAVSGRTVSKISPSLPLRNGVSGQKVLERKQPG
jgi:hypothetical protein